METQLATGERKSVRSVDLCGEVSAAPERAALADVLAKTEAAIASERATRVELQALSLPLEATLARHHLVVQQAEEARIAAAAERDTLQAHLRQVEDRAYGEVDRTRQELKAAKAQLLTQAREHVAALHKGEQARHEIQVAHGKAQRENAALQDQLAACVAAKRESPRKRPARTASLRPKA